VNGGEVLHSALHGAIAAAAMTGMRTLTVRGLLEKVAPAADHALYGLVLSETRSRPRR
jgi:hypothetical protein